MSPSLRTLPRTDHVNCFALRVIHRWTEKGYKVPSALFLRNVRFGYTILALCACGLTSQGWGPHCHQSVSWECEGCVSTGPLKAWSTYTRLFCFFIGCGKQPSCFSEEMQRKPRFEGWLGPRLKTGKALLLPQQRGGGLMGGKEELLIERRLQLGRSREARSGLSY